MIREHCDVTMKLHERYQDITAQRGRQAVNSRRVGLFDVSVQAQIAAVAATSSEVQDLAESFPAALFALATGYGTAAQRLHAQDLTVSGADLRSVGQALGLPWWLRKLPAAAFTRPIPKLPDGHDLAQGIIAAAPKNASEIANWLELISVASHTCSTDFALWVARQPALRAEPAASVVIATLCAWAWASLHPNAPTAALLRRRWTPEMSLKRALDERSTWLQRVALHASLSALPQRDWIADGSTGEFQFTQLRDARSFISAAKTLDNCLDQYAEPIAAGTANVFGVHRGGRLVACIEVRPHADHLGMPAVTQIKGPRNRRAAIDVWRATYIWLGGHITAPRPILGSEPSNTARIKAIDAVWLPYIRSLRGTGLTEQTSVMLRTAILQRLPRLARSRRTPARAAEQSTSVAPQTAPSSVIR